MKICPVNAICVAVRNGVRALVGVSLLAMGAFAAPNPPTKEDPMIAITPVTRMMDQTGGTAAINTSGEGTWRASVSDNWILLTGASGRAGLPVGYIVSANNGVEGRVGYVYVSGHVHTITQPGVGASLGEYSGAFEHEGGSGSVTVSAEDGNAWHARSNVDWITVQTASGSGTQQVRFTVAAYDEVSTRSGTLTIADNTYTVYQTGLRMRLKSTSSTSDYLPETIRIRIDALADTEWSVSASADWISVVDAGSGRGGDVVTVALAENGSYAARSGVVTIGTEEYAVRQLGISRLTFRADRTEAAFGKEGASGERILVTATPDLGWTAACNADWIELYADYKSGSGTGNVMYKVKPNPTLHPRSGEIIVTAADAGIAAKRIEISQEAAVATLTLDGYEFAAEGEALKVGVATGDIVGWSIANSVSWIAVSASASTGPDEVTLTAAANTSVQPRSGVLRIADHEFRVSQRGRGVTVDYKDKVFGTDGKTSGAEGDNVITVTTASDVSWTAVASDPTWIVIYEGASGRGNGTVKYIVAPYVGAGDVRTGMITVGDQVVYVAQRPYELSIEPNGTWAEGNAGAGEIQVALDIEGVWNAIATEPWITIVSGYDSGTGSGKVVFSYTDNNTGRTRTGKIMIAGTAYTLTQEARRNVAISAEASGRGGTVRGGGTYGVGSVVELEAVAEDGYAFVRWDLPGGGSSTEARLEVTAVSAAAYVAVFEPVTPRLTVADACFKGVTLAWDNLAWAAQYRVWRGTATDRAQATRIAELTNDGSCRYLDATGTEGQAYWYWIEAVGAEDDVWSGGLQGRRAKKSFAIAYENLRGTAHANPTAYTEGTAVMLSAPSARRGYTFVGWEPSAITADMSGDLTVRAIWLQNEYVVRFDLNGADAAMADENFTYGFWKFLAEANCTRSGYAFAGWATAKDGKVAYADKKSVKNLTAQLDDVVTLYAVWNALVGVEGDEGATVTGDAETGFVVKPSEGTTTVAVAIPDGIDAERVTIEVSPKVASVKPNGAKVKVVSGDADITEFLDVPAADGNGFVDLAKATVKKEIVKETTDPKKGAKIDLNADSPSLTTPNTRRGLVYQFSEGRTLDGMRKSGDPHVGDGKPWTPEITVKGGDAAFYSIGVTK